MFRLKRNTHLARAKFIAIMAVALISFTSCNKDCECDDAPPIVEEQYPFLRLVNENTNDAIVTSVRLLGYEFENLNIDVGESQMFTLENGMPGGYDDINVIVGWKRSAWQSGSVNAAFDFGNGDITTITFEGCISFGECVNGFYLE